LGNDIDSAPHLATINVGEIQAINADPTLREVKHLKQGHD
jgi:hypothetical protein